VRDEVFGTKLPGQGYQVHGVRHARRRSPLRCGVAQVHGWDFPCGLRSGDCVKDHILRWVCRAVESSTEPTPDSQDKFWIVREIENSFEELREIHDLGFSVEYTKDLEGDLEKAKEQAEDLRRELDDLKEERDGLKLKVEDLQDRIEDLEAV